MAPGSAEEPDGAAVPAQGQTVFVQLLGAVAAGIGVLGFVTFFGGAILWIRFDQAELPANEAVAVVPREVLLTTGASFLVPAMMLSLGAVLVVVLIRLVLHNRGQATSAPGGGDAPAPGRFEAALLFLVLIVEIGLVWSDAVNVSVPRAMALVAFGAGTLAISWFVLLSTRRLVWFGLALFGAVSAFTVATTYFRTTDRPKLEPVALLRDAEGPRTGFFVARRSDYIYFGRGPRTTDTPGGARLVAIPTADVTDISIGPLVSPDLVRRRAARLALGLCRTAELEARDDRAEAPPPPCSRAQIAALTRQAR
jgi:hypothetical protein